MKSKKLEEIKLGFIVAAVATVLLSDFLPSIRYWLLSVAAFGGIGALAIYFHQAFPSRSDKKGESEVGRGLRSFGRSVKQRFTASKVMHHATDLKLTWPGKSIDPSLEAERKFNTFLKSIDPSLEAERKFNRFLFEDLRILEKSSGSSGNRLSGEFPLFVSAVRERLLSFRGSAGLGLGLILLYEFASRVPSATGTTRTSDLQAAIKLAKEHDCIIRFKRDGSFEIEPLKRRSAKAEAQSVAGEGTRKVETEGWKHQDRDTKNETIH